MHEPTLVNLHFLIRAQIDVTFSICYFLSISTVNWDNSSIEITNGN